MSEITQEQVTQQSDPYLSRFEALEKEGERGGPSWVFPIRKAGISRFAELGFPTIKHEDWRFTNIRPITELPFLPVLEPSRETISEAALNRFAFAGLEAHRLVFVDGFLAPDLCQIESLPEGAIVGSLAEQLKKESKEVKDHFAGQINGEENAFTALNTAFFQDGAFIYLPKGTVMEKPIHLLFISTGSERGMTTHPRNLIIAEPHSELKLVESYAGLNDIPYLTNAVTESVIADEAHVEHCKLQNEPGEAFHMASLYSHQGRSSRFHFHPIAMGAHISRNTIRTTLDGEGLECVLNGLYLTYGKQLADNYMTVDHAKPHGESHEYFNGVMDEKSHGVFHGRILVRPHSQKTDAKQTNKNILLSGNAVVNAKPQLEIYADDVKCTHGATCGQLSDDAIFYLRARGLNYPTARRMLTHAFAGEIVERIRMDTVREELDRLVWDRLEQMPRLAQTAE